jgi:hypothetical protein
MPTKELPILKIDPAYAVGVRPTDPLAVSVDGCNRDILTQRESLDVLLEGWLDPQSLRCLVLLMNGV